MDGKTSDFTILNGELVLICQDCVTVLYETEEVAQLSVVASGRPGCPSLWSMGIVSEHQALDLQRAMQGLSGELILQ